MLYAGFGPTPVQVL